MANKRALLSPIVSGLPHRSAVFELVGALWLVIRASSGASDWSIKQSDGGLRARRSHSHPRHRPSQFDESSPNLVSVSTVSTKTSSDYEKIGFHYFNWNNGHPSDINLAAAVTSRGMNMTSLEWLWMDKYAFWVENDFENEKFDDLSFLWNLNCQVSHVFCSKHLFFFCNCQRNSIFCEKCIKFWLFDVSQSAAIHQELSALGLKTSILSLPSKFCLPGPLHQDIKLMLKSSSLHQHIRRTQNVAVAAHVVVVAALKYFLLKCSFLNHSCFISFTMPVPTLPIFCRNKFLHELNMLNHVSHWKNNGSLRKNLKRSTTGCKSWSWNLLSFFGRFLGQRITGAGGRRNLWLFEQ